jgi:hypothetical protein
MPLLSKNRLESKAGVEFHSKLKTCTELVAFWVEKWHYDVTSGAIVL